MSADGCGLSGSAARLSGGELELTPADRFDAEGSAYGGTRAALLGAATFERSTCAAPKGYPKPTNSFWKRPKLSFSR